MTIALIKIGQRLVKYDDFAYAYLIVHESSDQWMVEVEDQKGKCSPAFFGTYFECCIALERTMIIQWDELQLQPYEE